MCFPGSKQDGRLVDVKSESISGSANEIPSGNPRDPIHVLCTLNQNYLEHLEVLLVSLYVNNPGEHFVIHLAHREIPDHALSELAGKIAPLGQRLDPIKVEDALFQDAPVNKRYPAEMYFRLLAHELLKQAAHEPERVIYLDPDILIINPIRPLWEMNLEGNLFAAATHATPLDLTEKVNNLRLNTSTSYFNSGALLIDLVRAGKEVVRSKVFEYVRTHADILILPDQDVLNAMFGNRILEIPELIWNYDARMYRAYEASTLGEADENWIMDNTVVLHFCGRAKPWKPRYPFRFGTLYRHYMSLTRRLLDSDERD
ncbi:MAG: glycosyltransferase family 8 protein [Eggerthellaceae bacterium]